MEFFLAIETSFESAENHLADSRFVAHRFSEIVNGFVSQPVKGSFLKGAEALAHNDIVARYFFPMVLLHLGVDELRKLSVVILKHIRRFAHVLEIGLQMRDHLPRQVVKQVGVVVVRHVVEIHERPH